MTDQENIESFANIGRALGALHTSMVEFGMRREDATDITAIVATTLMTTAGADPAKPGGDETVIRCSECNGGWVAGKPEVHVGSCSRYVKPT